MRELVEGVVTVGGGKGVIEGTAAQETGGGGAAGFAEGTHSLK